MLTGRFSWQITREVRLAGIPRALAASEVVPLLIGQIRRIGRIGLIDRPGVPATIRRWLVHFKGDLNTYKRHQPPANRRVGSPQVGRITPVWVTACATCLPRVPTARSGCAALHRS